jgi:hypothetical protein
LLKVFWHKEKIVGCFPGKGFFQIVKDAPGECAGDHYFSCFFRYTFMPILHQLLSQRLPLNMLISLLKKRFYCLSFVVSFFLLLSCEEKTKLNTKEIVKEVRNRQIKRVTPSEIIEKVNDEGALIVASIEKNWLDALNFGLENKGVEYTKKFCIVPFIPGYDTIAGPEVAIRKLGMSALSHPEKLDKFEKQILEAYQYNVEKKIPLLPNTQKIGEKYLLYSSPIFVKDKMCLQCHSNNQKYGDFKDGGFAGIWSIKILKKSIIQKID